MKQSNLKAVKVTAAGAAGWGPSTTGGGWGTDPSWKADDSGDYDPDKFYVRATNKFNHASKARLNLPPDTMSMLQELVDRIPAYRNSHDLIRDAVHHRIQYLSNAGYTTPLLERWLNVERAAAVIEAARLETDALTQLHDDARSTLAELRRIGDTGKLALVLEQVELTAEGLREPWAGMLHNLVRSYRP